MSARYPKTFAAFIQAIIHIFDVHFTIEQSSKPSNRSDSPNELPPNDVIQNISHQVNECFLVRLVVVVACKIGVIETTERIEKIGRGR